jgi:hypothetical protein
VRTDQGDENYLWAVKQSVLVAILATWEYAVCQLPQGATMQQTDEEFVEYARQRASQLGETLGLEHKNWLSLEDPLHQAHLLRACLALRNQGGGWLVIGVDDGTGQRSPGAPADLRASYNADNIQKMVADFSTDPFEVAIAYPEITGGPVVVLRIAP